MRRVQNKMFPPLPTPTKPPSPLTYPTIIATLFGKKFRANFLFSFPSLPFVRIANAVAGFSIGPSAPLASVEISERLRFEGREVKDPMREAWAQA